MIVNPIPDDMNLKNGSMSTIILDKAGPDLQKHCNRRGFLRKGEVFETSGFRLDAIHIFHGICPDWNSGNTESIKVIHKF